MAVRYKTPVHSETFRKRRGFGLEDLVIDIAKWHMERKTFCSIFNSPPSI
jgi:hypothetical protein